MNKKRTFSLGHITDTRFWITFEIEPWKLKFPTKVAHFGPTYHGTKYGFIFGRGRLTIVAHYRPKGASQ